MLLPLIENVLLQLRNRLKLISNDDVKDSAFVNRFLQFLKSCLHEHAAVSFCDDLKMCCCTCACTDGKRTSSKNICMNMHVTGCEISNVHANVCDACGGWRLPLQGGNVHGHGKCAQQLKRCDEYAQCDRMLIDLKSFCELTALSMQQVFTALEKCQYSFLFEQLEPSDGPCQSTFVVSPLLSMPNFFNTVNDNALHVHCMQTQVFSRRQLNMLMYEMFANDVRSWHMWLQQTRSERDDGGVAINGW
jgi:hypothetical protein